MKRWGLSVDAMGGILNPLQASGMALTISFAGVPHGLRRHAFWDGWALNRLAGNPPQPLQKPSTLFPTQLLVKLEDARRDQAAGARRRDGEILATIF